MQVTTDKEGFVLKAKREAGEELMLPCKGGWHHNKGQATLLPSSHFRKIDRGVRKGEWAKTCNDCQQRAAASQRKMAEIRNNAAEAFRQGMGDIAMPDIQVSPVQSNNRVVAPTFKWKVTIIRETEVVVDATDFLDAGAKAGDGEIVKVERL